MRRCSVTPSSPNSASRPRPARGRQHAAHQRAAFRQGALRPRSGRMPLPGDSAKPAASASGEEYRRLRAQEAWALRVLGEVLPIEDIGPHDWKRLAAFIDEGAVRFLAAMPIIDRTQSRRDLLAALETAVPPTGLPQVTTWNLRDLNRVSMVPPQSLAPGARRLTLLRQPDAGGRHGDRAMCARCRSAMASSPASRRSMTGRPSCCSSASPARAARRADASSSCPRRRPVNCMPTAMAWSAVQWHRRNGPPVRRSRHGALEIRLPAGRQPPPERAVDRHVLAKRMRVWVNADGFITALNRDNLAAFEPGPPARWTFVANAGDRRTVPIELTVDMLNERNTTVIRVRRPRAASRGAAIWPIMRGEHHHPHRHRGPLLPSGDPAHPGSRGALRQGPHRRSDRRVRLQLHAGWTHAARLASDRGRYHNESEWCTNIPHPLEASSWPDRPGRCLQPRLVRDPAAPRASRLMSWSAPMSRIPRWRSSRVHRSARGGAHTRYRAIRDCRRGRLRRALAGAASAYVVRRDKLKTVIAGYPWFLDWGRDSLICARGLLAAGMVDEVRQLLITFARFEDGGTLPNFLNGEDASNRDTSDAPLWFGVVCEEAAALAGQPLRPRSWMHAAAPSRTCWRASPAAICAEPPTASASTCPPAWCGARRISPGWTPTIPPAHRVRAIPIEIQALWIRLLRQLERLKVASVSDPWWAIADRAQQSLSDRFWIKPIGTISATCSLPHRVREPARP
jgi:starch synthase (maltosyl-transferring)